MAVTGSQELDWVHWTLTAWLGAGAITCGWSLRRCFSTDRRWLLPLLWGATGLLGVWALGRLNLHLGYAWPAAVLRPHYYTIALAGLFFFTLVFRLKRTRDDYLRLLRANLTAQEDERRRIARDLHDGVGQALQALKLRLQIERRTRVESEAASRRERNEISDTVALVDGCIQELRSVASQLRPVYLGRMPLVEALRSHAEQFTRDAGVQLDFQSNEVSVVSSSTEEHLFRIIQEALSNSIRHGQASRIEVTVDQRDGELKLAVRDDGRGDSARAAPGSGHGLPNMRERAELIGGRLRFERDKSGAALEVMVRLPKERERQPGNRP